MGLLLTFSGQDPTTNKTSSSMVSNILPTTTTKVFPFITMESYKEKVVLQQTTLLTQTSSSLTKKSNLTRTKLGSLLEGIAT